MADHEQPTLNFDQTPYDDTEGDHGDTLVEGSVDYTTQIEDRNARGVQASLGGNRPKPMRTMDQLTSAEVDDLVREFGQAYVDSLFETADRLDREETSHSK